MTKKNLPKLAALRRRRATAGAPKKVPRITNDTVAEHREEVLGRARKFVNPLRHSRSRIVKWSIGLVVTAVILFLVGTALALYKFQSTSTFVYGVTTVVPFPVAYADGRFVSYQSYLFELRHYMHYYHTQQNVNFSTPTGQRQLASLKQRSLNTAISRAYVAKLAAEHHVRVSSQEVDQQVMVARSQNRLGASDSVFRSVLNDFWGWSVTDFRHELYLELLDQKVAATLDTTTTKRATDVYQQLGDGADFAKLAKRYSDDTATKAAGGSYGQPITEANRDLLPLVVQAIFSLKQGQYSGIINTGYTLEIVKVTKIDGDKRQAAHIAFNYNDIDTYIKPLRQQHRPTEYIHPN